MDPPGAGQVDIEPRMRSTGTDHAFANYWLAAAGVERRVVQVAQTNRPAIPRRRTGLHHQQCVVAAATGIHASRLVGRLRALLVADFVLQAALDRVRHRHQQFFVSGRDACADTDASTRTTGHRGQDSAVRASRSNQAARRRVVERPALRVRRKGRFCALSTRCCSILK